MGEFFSGVVQAGYQDSLDKEGHQKMLSERQLLSQAEYENFYNFHYPNDGAKLVLASYGQGRYRLSGIDQHKRIYEASTACISD
jgi:hydroxymethylglutaryl-CoA synthase